MRLALLLTAQAHPGDRVHGSVRLTLLGVLHDRPALPSSVPVVCAGEAGPCSPPSPLIAMHAAPVTSARDDPRRANRTTYQSTSCTRP